MSVYAGLLLPISNYFRRTRIPVNLTGYVWIFEITITTITLGFPGGSDNKESTCSAGDLGSISGLGWSPGEGHDNPLQYSYLENPHGQRGLRGYSPRGGKELDTTERLSTAQHHTFDKTKKLSKADVKNTYLKALKIFGFRTSVVCHTNPFSNDDMQNFSQGRCHQFQKCSLYKGWV